MVKKKSFELKDVPEGVRIIGVLYFIGALISLVLGSILLSFSDNIRQNAAAVVQAGIKIPSSTVLLFAGIVLLALAVFEYFLAKAVFRRANWARFTIAFISALGVVGAVINLKNGIFAGGTFSLLVNSLIIWYLLFSTKVRKAFD